MKIHSLPFIFEVHFFFTAFDLMLDGLSTTTSKRGFGTDTDDLTISMWLQTRSAEGRIAITQPDGTVSLELTFGNSLSLRVSG